MRRARHALNRRMRDDCSLAGMNAERPPVDSAGGHCRGLHIVDVLKLIDEIAKLAFARGKQNALDQHRRTNSCPYPEILLEFRTGPDRKARNIRFGCRRANLAEASAARERYGALSSIRKSAL